MPQASATSRTARSTPDCPPEMSFMALFPYSFFGNLLRLYLKGWRKPDMAINGRRNKPFGPGGGTRRLHHFLRGRNRIDEGVKDALLPGMVPALSGQIHSCKRQLCSGCSGCVTQFERPI